MMNVLINNGRVFFLEMRDLKKSCNGQSVRAYCGLIR